MSAVIHIFSHDVVLQKLALSFVDIERQEIDWYSIFRSNLAPKYYAAVLWAYCLWKSPLNVCNVFESAFVMDAGLRRTVIQAIAIRWNLPLENIQGLRLA